MIDIVIQVPELPDGYEYTGEYKKTVFGDMYLNSKNEVSVKTFDSVSQVCFLHVRFAGHPWIDEPAIPSKILEDSLNFYVKKKWENV